MLFKGEVQQLEKGLIEIEKLVYLKDDETVYVTQLEEDSPYCIEIGRGKENFIRYKERYHFFRAVGLYVTHSEYYTKDFQIQEKRYIPYCGMMLDVSRNSVYKVEEIKKLLRKLAILGYDHFMLYTEDTYELHDYPYFGYLRGRYTEKELREIDTYALHFGIEVIPCIQTLGHLKTTLRWQYAMTMRDTSDILMVGEEKTYELIEAMVQTMHSIFSSKRIHIGMDETEDLGLGRYLLKNGHKTHMEIMTEHLHKVCDIVKKYNLEPMMWDDMFFTANAPNHWYYDSETVITEELVEKVPEEVELVYWDYFHTKEEDYQMFFDKRKVFKNKVTFAGGIWKWMGYVPHHDRTLCTARAALKMCKAFNIQRVIATAWGDDGDEAPLDTALLGMIFFAEHAYQLEVDDKALDKQCKLLSGYSWDEFKSMQELDCIEGVERPNHRGANPSKYLLYQDVLMGAFDSHIEGLELYDYYIKLANQYEVYSKRNASCSELFKLYMHLGRVLAYKATLGAKLRKAYKEGNQEQLMDIVNQDIPVLAFELEAFHVQLREIWYATCKGHGFEVLEIRVGGLKARLETARYRIKQYLKRNISQIEELEETILPFKDFTAWGDKIISYNRYQNIATQNVLSW